MTVKSLKFFQKNNRAYMITVKDKKNGKKVNIKFKNLFILLWSNKFTTSLNEK